MCMHTSHGIFVGVECVYIAFCDVLNTCSNEASNVCTNCAANSCTNRPPYHRTVIIANSRTHHASTIATTNLFADGLAYAVSVKFSESFTNPSSFKCTVTITLSWTIQGTNGFADTSTICISYASSTAAVLPRKQCNRYGWY